MLKGHRIELSMNRNTKLTVFETAFRRRYCRHDEGVDIVRVKAENFVGGSIF